MLIAGAGGHAIEILDILLEQGITDELYFFDNLTGTTLFQNKYPVLNSFEEAQEHFKKDPRFILGVGNPETRQVLEQQLSDFGGQLTSLRGSDSAISTYANLAEVDVFNFCHIGGNAKIERGCLINTGTQVHHEVEIAEFSVINPGAILLGACKIGRLSYIGAHATILPGVQIGDRVTVGAGAVIIRDVPDGVTVVGVPGRVISGQ